MNYLAQLFGLVSLVLLCISYQQNKKEKLLYVQIFANIFYFIQYILLNAFSAAGANIITIFRTFLFYFKEKEQKKIPLYYLIIFSILIVVLGIVTYNSIYSLIPIFILAAYTYGTWQNNLKVMYIIFISAAFLWIVYNFMVGAYVSIIGSCVEITASILGLRKIIINEMKGDLNNGKI